MLVRLGTDNKIGLQLYEKSESTGELSEIDLSGTQRMTITFGATTIDSNVAPSCFDWTQGEGILYLELGMQTIPEGRYRSKLTIYDSVNTNGVIMPELLIEVVD